jgi:hypothetical protein
VCALPLVLLLLLLQAAVFSALGLAAGLLLETALLIIRTNMPVPLDQKYAHLLDKRWDKLQQQRQQQQQFKQSSGDSISGSRTSGASTTLRRRQGGGDSIQQEIEHAKHE